MKYIRKFKRSVGTYLNTVLFFNYSAKQRLGKYGLISLLIGLVAFAGSSFHPVSMFSRLVVGLSYFFCFGSTVVLVSEIRILLLLRMGSETFNFTIKKVWITGLAVFLVGFLFLGCIQLILQKQRIAELSYYFDPIQGFMPFSLSFLLKMTPTWAIDVFLITHVLLKKTKPILNTTTFPHVKTIEFTAGSNTFRFNPDNISHISIDQHYATFFIIITEGLKEVQVKASMKKIMDFLPPQQFCRIHRSHSVNLNQIERIISVEGNNSVKLKGSELVLPISRRQLIIVKSNFQKWMEAKLIQPTNPKLMTE